MIEMKPETKQWYRALFGSYLLIILLGVGAIINSLTKRWSFIWFWGIIMFAISYFIMLHIIYKFIKWNDKEIDCNNVDPCGMKCGEFSNE